MAYAASNSSVAPRALASAGTGIVARFKDALHRRSVYTRTIRELSGLTTRELADLGLNRSMITRVALEAAYGK
ncbi:MAG: DUF1127 domain-containing protein [Gemmobacter sp.]|nr:DUF1127 domain-containing protein [Gemmobacter sp.]